MSRGSHPSGLLVRVRILVSGRVQGVGFRYAAVDQGRRLDLLGWARNTADGRVEIVAEGLNEKVQEMIAWCHTGPPAARVTAVQQATIAADEDLNGFRGRW